uniref:Uncharacterized protein n=1 Tax=uncultured Desulfobacterium sp. TaxID=201089 RepID=E1YEJ6_9BACT|nr:unknown protein [uncultured Desulfobacterium sp.]
MMNFCENMFLSFCITFYLLVHRERGYFYFQSLSPHISLNISKHFENFIKIILKNRIIRIGN